MQTQYLQEVFNARELFSLSWQDVYTKVIGAVVFIDDTCAECLHWDGGVNNFFNAGVCAVKTLSPFEFAENDQKKGVFFTNSLVTNLDTVKEIIKNSNFSHAILIVCTSPEILYHELNEGKDATDLINSGKIKDEVTKQMESMLTSWLNKKPCLVEVSFVPIFLVPFTSVVFVMPPFRDLYPTFYGAVQFDQPSSVDMFSISPDDRSQVRRLTAAFNSLFELMNSKEDIFYMGTFSSVVAGAMEHMPSAVSRRKNATKQISLIFLDRTLDLCDATAYNCESMWDKLSSVLPRFPNHSTDLSVDMSPICAAPSWSSQADVHLCPGCFHHSQNEQCLHTFDHMVYKSQKEVMFDLNNQLSKLDLPKSPSSKLLQRVTGLSLEKQILPVQGKYDIITPNSGLLQQALGVVQMLKSPKLSEIDLVISLEKQILLSIATSKDSTSILKQISHIIKTRRQRELSLEALLSLLVFVYSISGCEFTFSAEHESELIDILSIAIFEDDKKILFASEETSRSIGPEKCNSKAKEILARLKNMATVRKHLQKYRSILRQTEVGCPVEYKGVTDQLIDDLVDIAKPDIPDLKYRSDGFKDLIRTGLSLFRNAGGKKSRSTKHPLDNPLVIIFIIGGTTADDCKRLHRSVITSGIDTQVIIGSTRMVNPIEATRQILNLQT